MKMIPILHLLQPWNLKAKQSLNKYQQSPSAHETYTGSGKDIKTEKTQLNFQHASSNTLTSLWETTHSGEVVWKPPTSLQPLTTKFPARLFYHVCHVTLYSYSLLTPWPFTLCPHHCSSLPSIKSPMASPEQNHIDNFNFLPLQKQLIGWSSPPGC